MNASDPLLTVCVPTFNRAPLLEKLLWSLGKALDRIGGEECEVVICDNASDDLTPDIARNFCNDHNAIYVRNERNIGSMLNILYGPRSGTGRFLWLVGDDDLVSPKALDTLLECLRSPSLSQTTLVNYHIVREYERTKIQQHVSSGVQTTTYKTFFPYEGFADSLPNLQAIFSRANISPPLNFISSVVCPREAWISASQKYISHCETRPPLSDAWTCGSHVLIWLEVAASKPVHVVREPAVFGFVGQQPFLSRWEVISSVFFLDLSESMPALGLERADVLHYRRGLYPSPDSLLRLTVSNDEYVRRQFSLLHLLLRYGDDPVLWRVYAEALRKAKTVIALRRLLLPGIWARLRHLVARVSRVRA
jgi:hypothetical protein